MSERVVTVSECEREAEVFDAACSGYWPDEVSRHVRHCPVCRDLAAVAIPLRREHDEASSDARVPTAGQVWWRATMRRRAEAAAAAARPITCVQGIAVACAVSVSVALVRLAWPSVAPPIESLTALLNGLRVDAAAPLGTVAMTVTSLAVLGGAGLILAPVIFYLVLSDE